MQFLLVVNFGGSSFRYRAYAITDMKLIGRGHIENLGLPYATLKTWDDKGNLKLESVGSLSKEKGLERLFNDLVNEEGPIKNLLEISYVAHKLAHGGPDYIDATIIDERVERALEEFSTVVPIHNGASLTAIRLIRNVLPDAFQIGVFETEFHKGLPDYVTSYGLPYELKEKYGIRKYGFHGASHRYISEKVRELFSGKLTSIKLINCHLGSGTSVAAIKDGKSIEISSGFTPQSGTMMSTRAGDYDAEVLYFLNKICKMSFEEIRTMLIEGSGIKGISGISGDLEVVMEAALQGNQRANLAVDAFCYKVKQNIGASTASLNGVDVLTFTGGIGENNPEIRRRICAGFDYLGLKLDADKNTNTKYGLLSTDDSKVAILSLETDEEYIVAREALNLIKRKREEL